MNKKPDRATVLQICGFRGLIFITFAVVCLAAGFIVFPAFILQNIWNYFPVLPAINIYQGLMLWAIIAIVFYINNKSVVSMRTHKAMSEDEIQNLINNIRENSRECD